MTTINRHATFLPTGGKRLCVTTLIRAALKTMGNRAGMVVTVLVFNCFVPCLNAG